MCSAAPYSTEWVYGVISSGPSLQFVQLMPEREAAVVCANHVDCIECYQVATHQSWLPVICNFPHRLRALLQVPELRCASAHPVLPSAARRAHDCCLPDPPTC
jgi:hypothetical protein